MNLAKTSWSDIEHNILVQKTNKQIELEEEDRSKTISWAEHWLNISLCLKQHGYNRTKKACQAYYWRQVIQSQDIDTEPAQRDGDNSESSTTATTEYYSLEDSSNKRPLQERETCIEEDPTQPFKKRRVGDVFCQEADDKGPAPSQASSERPSDGPPVTTEEAQVPSVSLCRDISPNPTTDGKGIQAMHKMAIANLVTTVSETARQNSVSRDCSESASGPRGRQSPISAPVSLSTSKASKRAQTVWASAQVQNIQTELQALNGEAAERTKIIASVDQELQALKGEYDKILQKRGQDLARVVWEVKKQYNAKLDVLRSKVRMLKESKQKEQDKMKCSSLEIAQQERGLRCYNAVIDYLKHGENESS